MTFSAESIIEDFAPFADLGTEPPLASILEGAIILRLIRDGNPITLKFFEAGHITENLADDARHFPSRRAVLASVPFANLGKWADSQKLLLKANAEEDSLPISGTSSDGVLISGLGAIDELISADPKLNFRNVVTLIDEPAGIGKTSVIRKLAYNRAKSYRILQNPLILHVESRGRVLQNLTDLMAFSLQTLRVPVTYDQIPTLVRSGLLTLAIDGFDELGDPNGYDLAWAQLNDLIIETRGSGNIILSGRETFISRERIRRSLHSISDEYDQLKSITISHIGSNTAKKWLIERGWSKNLVESEIVSPLFESDSYALRPFFLQQLAEPDVAAAIEHKGLEDLLGFLISAMVERETRKFGRDVEAVTSLEQRTEFIVRLMEEVSRDLAENQADSIPSETLIWLSDIVASDSIAPEVAGILKNRAGVVAFLTDDIRRGHRRFIHEQVQNYFLAHVTVKAVCRGELPKYIRRNIIGLDFLQNFAQVVRYISPDILSSFIDKAVSQISSISDHDRARGNLAALVIASLSITSTNSNVLIENIGFDEIFFGETMAPITFKNVVIAQLQARGADLTNLVFGENCTVVSMIADKGTLPGNIPVPTILSLPDITLTEPWDIENWIANKTREIDVDGLAFNKDLAREFPPFNLFQRLIRYKPFWLKVGGGRAAHRILDDENWELLKTLMLKHELLIERHDVPSSGRPAPFYHVKNRQILMEGDWLEVGIFPFIIELLRESVAKKKIKE